MLKKELRGHLLTTLVWLMVISLVRWDWLRQPADLLSFWLGGLMGFLLLDVDHYLYALVLYPHQLTSLRIQRLLKQKRFRETAELIVDTDQERVKLSFHNALFQLVFYIFCFFALTSTDNWFGKGLVMDMALHLLKDEVVCLLRGQDEFLRRWLFSQFNVRISFKHQRFFVILMILIFLGLNLFLI